MRTTLIALLLLAASSSLAADAKLDAEAGAAIRRMSDLLASSKTLSFRSSATITTVRRDGSKHEREITNDVLVRRPDAARFRMVGGGRDGIIWYEAGRLALQGNKQKVYALAEAPPTLDDAMDYVAARLAIPMPTADLLYSSPHDALVSPETTGRVIGRETVGEESCVHLAFVDPVVDWEIWVREGDRPLPCRLRIVYKLVEGLPEARVAFSDWNLAPEVKSDSFAFTPPEGFRRIRIVGRAVDGAATPATP